MTGWSIARALFRKQVVVLGGLWLAAGLFTIVAATAKTNELFDAEIESVGRTLASLDAPTSCRTDTMLSCRTEAAILSGERADYLSYQIRDRNGTVLFRSLLAPEEPFPIPVAAGFTNQGATRYFTSFYPGGRTAVQVAAGPEERLHTLLWMLGAIMVPLVCLFPMTWVLVEWTARETAGPVQQIVRSLQSRSAQQLDPISTVNIPLELNPILSAMNKLLQRLRSALDQERAFAANCAHELRNPLAAATAQAELLIEDTKHDSGPAMLDSLRNLTHKLERLMQLSRAEAGVGLRLSRTDLQATVKFIIEDYYRSGVAQDRLDLKVHSGCEYVSLDRDALGIVLRNLIDNSLKYSPMESTINIIMEADCSLRVVNEAEPLPPELLDRILARFERGTDFPKGDGLGLAIVREIVSKAGGAVQVRSTAKGRTTGFEVCIKLPKIAALPADAVSPA